MPVESHLFNLLLADLEDEMGRIKWEGGIKIGEGRVHSLAYADDSVVDRLVWTVVGYGAEIWGWRERETVERMQERFLRWKVEGKTPGYLVRKETQRLLRNRAGRRA